MIQSINPKAGEIQHSKLQVTVYFVEIKELYGLNIKHFWSLMLQLVLKYLLKYLLDVLLWQTNFLSFSYWYMASAVFLHQN